MNERMNKYIFNHDAVWLARPSGTVSISSEDCFLHPKIALQNYQFCFQGPRHSHFCCEPQPSPKLVETEEPVS